jgi:hypothetical protein
MLVLISSFVLFDQAANEARYVVTTAAPPEAEVV